MMTALDHDIRALYKDDAQVSDLIPILWELLARIEALEQAAEGKQS